LKDLAVQVDPSRNKSELDVSRKAWVRVILMDLKPEQVVVRVSIEGSRMEGSRMAILGEPCR
jgi:hypothetical protein